MIPVVAIVGRPNVGKSTLFNRLVRRRRAIVHDRPGVTRDRIVERADLDDGRPVDWIDTGGLVPGSDPIGINEQVRLAIEGSDALLLLVDGTAGTTTADERVAEELRRSHKPVILVVNKGDTRVARESIGDFYRLQAGEPVLVSAEHGTGIEELRARLLAELPSPDGAAEPAVPDDAFPVAIVGRPNVGKSSLLNRLAGEPRALVSPTPGTTRDPVDSLLTRGDRSYRLIDTAGIRRRSQVADTPEDLAVLLARRQIERASVAILVVDATAGVTSGDLAIAGAIWEAGRGAIVAINKWDLTVGETRERLERSWPRLDEILAGASRVNVSALSGRGVEKLFPAIERARVVLEKDPSTAEVNRLFERAVEAHHPPSLKGKTWKLYYATRVSKLPPTFILFANRTLPQGHVYRRYLENRVREELDLAGVPVRLVVRPRERARLHGGAVLGSD